MEIGKLVERVAEIGKGLEIKASRRGGLEAAVVFQKATEGTATWYTIGKRQVHEPQLEAIAGEVQKYTEGIDTIVELGAGKGLLGRVLQEVTKKPVIAIERRDCTTYDGHDVTRLNADLQEVSLNDTIPSNSLVIAKHFCGNATDTAVTMICASPKVTVAALAPCCHPQIQWDSYTGTAYLTELGFTKDDLPNFLDLITMSRYSKGISQKDCKRWTELRDLGQSVCYQSGRHIRRIIEEGRMRALQNAGFSTCLVQYAPDAVSPDNFLILASRRTVFPIPMTPAAQVFPSPQGLIMHANGEQSVPDRVAEYWLEKRSVHLTETGTSCIKSVEMHAIQFGGGMRKSDSDSNAIVVVVIGEPAELLPILEEPLLTRVVDMVIPFTTHSSSERSVEFLSGLLKKTLKESESVRLCCVPRVLEKELLPEVPTEQLSPTNFTHALFAIDWKDRMGHRCLLASVIPKDVFDMRKWRQAACGAVMLAGKPVTKKNQKTVVMFIDEMEKRHPSHACKGKKVVVVCDDFKDGNADLIKSTIIASGAASAECVVPIKKDDMWVVHDVSKNFDLAIFRLDRGDVPAIMRAMIPYLLPGSPIYGKVKLGVQSRGRRVTEKLVAAWKDAGFKKTLVWHFLTDKETDRTIVSRTPE